MFSSDAGDRPDSWVRKTPWRRKWQPAPYSYLKNPMAMYIAICKIDEQCKFECMKQGTQSQCSGTAQRDRVGREVGRMFRMGVHMSIVIAKNPPNIVIILQLKQIN